MFWKCKWLKSCKEDIRYCIDCGYSYAAGLHMLCSEGYCKACGSKEWLKRKRQSDIIEWAEHRWEYIKDEVHAYNYWREDWGREYPYTETGEFKGAKK